MAVSSAETTLESLDVTATAPLDYIDIIETVISSLADADSAQVSHTGSGTIWKFRYGQLEVFVQLTGSSEDDLFTVWSKVFPLSSPADASLLHRLLTLNWAETLEARFALYDDHVTMVASRTVADLSAGEISRAITLVASIAATYVNGLPA
ncbi:YbjN domain-containing protein [Synechococcus elongatus IITB7]|uniref:YbjN domain-containing protein n=1 Tax=Synechococcus elongatus TaxID=32046 RepID=UPI0030D3A843